MVINGDCIDATRGKYDRGCEIDMGCMPLDSIMAKPKLLSHTPRIILFKDEILSLNT